MILKNATTVVFLLTHWSYEMSINIKSTQAVIHNVNCLLYGESGIGKTTILATAPDPLILSIEGGLLTLADKDIPVIEIKSVDDINEVYEWLSKSKEADKYRTICIDSLSEMAEVILVEEMSATPNGQRAYGQMADKMAVSIRGFRDLPKHTVFTAKVRKIVDEATGSIRFFASVPGQQLLNNLPYFFDEVFRMDFGKTKRTKDRPSVTYRYIDTVGNRQFICKDRSGKLDEQEQPDLNKIFAKITAKKKPTENALTQTQTKPQEGK